MFFERSCEQLISSPIFTTQGTECAIEGAPESAASLLIGAPSWSCRSVCEMRPSDQQGAALSVRYKVLQVLGRVRTLTLTDSPDSFILYTYTKCLAHLSRKFLSLNFLWLRLINKPKRRRWRWSTFTRTPQSLHSEASKVLAPAAGVTARVWA